MDRSAGDQSVPPRIRLVRERSGLRKDQLAAGFS